MKRSVERILTTHTGSLPRPPALADALIRGLAVDPGLVRQSVQDIVRQQVDAGVDVVNDGEMSKESYSTYVRQRLSGFEGEAESVIQLADLADYPAFLDQWMARVGPTAGSVLQPPACVQDIKVKDRAPLEADIQNLRDATSTSGVEPGNVFMSSASPGVVAAFFANHHYPNEEAFLAAIADAMREEYEAIAAAGFVLQLDCPDLAMCRHLQFSGLSLNEFRARAQLHLEVLNHATSKIDPDQMRIHLCWGNYEGPHHHDVPLRDIIDVVFEARANGISLEAANPRHEHEWRVFEDVKLPDGKVLIPGVIDSTMNYIEHPELIAQRLVRYASLVGQENVIGSSDCGFATGAGTAYVDPAIVWAKFAALAEGAKLATDELQGAVRA